MLELSTLEKIPLFEGLSEKQFKKLQRVLRRQTINDNSVVLRDGDRGDALFILIDGEVQISKALASTLPQFNINQKDKSIIRLSSAEYAFFGEMALLDKNNKRAATVTTTKKTVIAVLRRADFEALIQDDLHIGITLLHNLAKNLSIRLGKANQDIMKLTVAFSLALER